jgi:hypothetical protein
LPIERRPGRNVIEFRHLPLCLAPLRAPATLGGQSVRCPRCKAMVKVPLSDEQRDAEALSKVAAKEERAAKAEADRILKSAERDADAILRRAEYDAAPPPVPRQYSPFAWGCGIVLGIVFANVLLFFIFGASLLSCIF